jgi:hypothetical protein
MKAEYFQAMSFSFRQIHNASNFLVPILQDEVLCFGRYLLHESKVALQKGLTVPVVHMIGVL